MSAPGVRWRVACVILPVLLLAWRSALLAADALIPSEPPITAADRDHWAYRPIESPPIPTLDHHEPLANPIDAFIAAKLEEQGLHLQPAASPATLLRRLALDLTGLPPTDQTDPSDRTDRPFNQHVDALLADPSYGEHWAQHWLDVARFAETDGFEHDKIRPEAWKFRDWVIDALNADLPFDQFVQLQLAGDELHPDDDDAVTATQFCLSGPDMPDLNSQDERRHAMLNEITSTIGTAFLGLQVGCAECHDHKYDAISQADFYRLRAVFEPSIHTKRDKPVAAFSTPGTWDEPSFVMERGDFRRPGAEVSPGALRVASLPAETENAASWQAPQGRRTKLARWITDRRNPLTARVAVNRIWQQHFGRGLSDSPGDFGVMGQEPTHPELLDWLAAWFMDHGWSLKQLHKLIVTSATWQQRSYLPPDVSDTERAAWSTMLQADPENRLWSRAPRRRMTGEMLRDTMLQTAGLLNRKTGGPGVRPPLPVELQSTLLKDQWVVTPDAAEHDRRSIYVFARRNLRYPVFDVFDRPDANATCPIRNQSTTAVQALNLLNSEFSVRMSRAAAERVAVDVEPDKRISAVFQLILSRAPTPGEQVECKLLLEESDGTSDIDQLAHLCLVLMNTSEFLMLD